MEQQQQQQQQQQLLTPTKKFKLKSVLSTGDYEPFVHQVTTNLEVSFL